MSDNESTMDGAPGDEASELWEVGTEGEVEPPHSLSTEEVFEDPLGNSDDDGSLSSQNL